MRMRYLVFCLTAFFMSIVVTGHSAADTQLSGETLSLIDKAVFEVVVPKPAEDSLSYEKPLPMDLIPYAMRNDKYFSMGTAFAIGANRFVTAGHVFRLGADTQFGEPQIRDRNGKVYEIDKILKYSEHRDFVLFSLKNKTADGYLEMNPIPKINQKVYAVGNALGEGVVVRDGLFTSVTPEARKGEWKWLRFSAAASPGNSGGPLLDADGKVLGVIIGKNENENLNYALPMVETLKSRNNSAEIQSFSVYGMDNADFRERDDVAARISLPKSFHELKEAYTELSQGSMANAVRHLFIGNRGRIFPLGEHSEAVFYSTSKYDFTFPTLLKMQPDGTWQFAQPEKITDAELPAGGKLRYGNLAGGLFLSIRKPDDIALGAFQSDSGILMDTILIGLRIPRKFGKEEVRITSLGKAAELPDYTDAYGRKWLVRKWNIEFSDEKILTFLLPVPGGYAGMIKFANYQDSSFGGLIDLKLLSNFISLHYEGSIDEWRDFLREKDMLPSAFSSLDIRFDADNSIHYRSKRLSGVFDSGALNLTKSSRLKLAFGYFNENNGTVWDVAGLEITTEAAKETGMVIVRATAPPRRLDKAYAKWEAVYSRRFPWDGKAFQGEDAAKIGAAIAVNAMVAYTVQYRMDGVTDLDAMEKTFAPMLANIKILEDNDQPAESAGKIGRSYPDRGDYHLAVFNSGSARQMTPQYADGYLFRGNVFFADGELKRALDDYEKAVALSPERFNSVAKQVFPALRDGVSGHMDDAEKKLKAIFQADTINTSVELLLRASRDAIDGRITGEAASTLFRGLLFDYLMMRKDAFAEYDKAVEAAPGYGIAFDMRGVGHMRAGNDEAALRDYSHALELNPNDYIAIRWHGIINRRAGKYDEALPYLEKAISLNPDCARSYGNRANIYLSKRYYAAASADFDTAIRLAPLYEDAIFARGQMRYSQKDYSGAIEDYSRVLELNRNDVNALNRRGNAWAELAEYDKAAIDFNAVREIDPSEVNAYYNEGLSSARKGEHRKAIESFTLAAVIDPARDNAYRARAASFLALRRNDEALADYNAAVEAAPASVDVYRDRGVYHVRTGNLDKAAMDFSKAIEIEPSSVIAYIGMADVMIDNGNCNGALAYIEEAMHIAPDKAEPYVQRGKCRECEKNHDAAIADYSRAIELNPSYVNAYIGRGEAYSVMGDKERALADFDAAIRINPNFSNSYAVRGKYFIDNADLDMAMLDLSKAMELDSNDVNAYAYRGWIFLKRGAYGSAVADLTKAINTGRANSTAYMNRAIGYRELKDYDRAVADLNSAIAIDSQAGRLIIERGLIYQAKGDFNTAVDDFSSYISMHPEDAKAYVTRGIANSYMGDAIAAIDDFSKAIELDQSNSDAYNNRGYAYRKNERYGDALRDYNRALELSHENLRALINRAELNYVLGYKDSACADWKAACNLGECKKLIAAKRSAYCP
ncbi:MAG: tetratricopeptide repeat protein [Nitrospirae bacterium]|nr:tetratricopeptide repeat protein [Nitrospirota bacterium]